MLRSLHSRLVIALPPSQDVSPAAALNALDSFLKEERGGRSSGRFYGWVSVEVIVADSFVRYGMIPWSDEIKSADELEALTRLHFESLYGSDGAHWTFQIDRSLYGKPAVACALDKAFIESLQAICKAHEVRLKSLKPYFMHAFNQWRTHLHLRIDGQALFAVIEPSQCVLAACKDGAWRSIRAIRLGHDVQTQLPAIFEREIVLQELDEQTPVYVHASNVQASNIDLSKLSEQFPRMTVLRLPYLPDACSGA